MRFRKKPVEVEAWTAQSVIAAAKENWTAIPAPIATAYERGQVFFTDNSVEIVTLEGTMTARTPDWIIKGVKGELYPCRPEIFIETYEPVGTEDDDGTL